MRRIYKRVDQGVSGALAPSYWDAIADSGSGPKQPKQKWKFKPNVSQGVESFQDVVEGLLAKEPLLGEEDEDLKEAKFWWPLMRPPASRAEGDDYGMGADERHPPWLLVSVQLVPESKLEELPAGHGRSEPNTNPVLPKPVGRLKFTLNPFKMFLQLLGPKLCKRLM